MKIFCWYILILFANKSKLKTRKKLHRRVSHPHPWKKGEMSCKTWCVEPKNNLQTGYQEKPHCSHQLLRTAHWDNSKNSEETEKIYCDPDELLKLLKGKDITILGHVNAKPGCTRGSFIQMKNEELLQGSAIQFFRQAQIYWGKHHQAPSRPHFELGTKNQPENSLQPDKLRCNSQLSQIRSHNCKVLQSP